MDSVVSSNVPVVTTLKNIERFDCAARLDKLRSSALTPGGRSEGDRWAGQGRSTLRFAFASLADDRLTLVKARFAGLVKRVRLDR